MLEPNQIEMMYGVANFKVWTHVTCRRSGKTVGAANVVMNHILKPNYSAVMVVPNYHMKVYLKDIFQLLLPESIITKISSSGVLLRNNSYVNFRLPTTDTINNDISPRINSNLIVYEEAGPIKNDSQFPVYLAMTNSKILITGTLLDTKEESILNIGVKNGQNPFITDWGSKSYPWYEVNYWKNNKDHLRQVKTSLSTESFNRWYNCK